MAWIVLAALSIWGATAFAASYPSSIFSFTTHNTGDIIAANDVNAPDNEIVAIESGLLNGLQHTLKPLTNATYDLGTSTFGWRNAYITGTIFGGGGVAVPNIQSFTSGSGTYTTPTNSNGDKARALLVRMVGGGGGGGGNNTANEASPGGGSGAYCELWLTSLSATYSYAVGGGGAGGSNVGGNGANGVDTTFSTATAGHGSGATGTPSGTAGAGGTGTSCTFALAGQPGGGASTATALVGTGGGSPWLGGGGPGGQVGNGANATANTGGGGSGGGGTSVTGGNGAAGFIVVVAFF